MSAYKDEGLIWEVMKTMHIVVMKYAIWIKNEPGTM